VYNTIKIVDKTGRN